MARCDQCKHKVDALDLRECPACEEDVCDDCWDTANGQCILCSEEELDDDFDLDDEEDRSSSGLHPYGPDE